MISQPFKYTFWGVCFVVPVPDTNCFPRIRSWIGCFNMLYFFIIRYLIVYCKLELQCIFSMNLNFCVGRKPCHLNLEKCGSNGQVRSGSGSISKGRVGSGSSAFKADRKMLSLQKCSLREVRLPHWIFHELSPMTSSPQSPYLFFSLMLYC